LILASILLSKSFANCGCDGDVTTLFGGGDDAKFACVGVLEVEK